MRGKSVALCLSLHSIHQAGTRVILTFVIAGSIDHNMVIIFYLLGIFFLPSVISTDYSSVASYVDHLTTTTLSHASVLVVDGQDSLTNTVMDTLSDQIHIIANLHQANGKVCLGIFFGATKL